MGLSPSQFGKLTPVEYSIMIDGYIKFEERKQMQRAEQAIMYRRAMNERTISINKLIGKKDDTPPEEHKNRFDEALEKMGPNVIPIRRGVNK